MFHNVPGNVMANVHTHFKTSGPSPQHIQTAKDNKMVVYVVDGAGWHAVGAGGKITTVYSLGGNDG